MRRALVFVWVFTSACATAPIYRGAAADGTHRRGSVEKVEPLGGHSRLSLRTQLLFAGLPEKLEVDHGVELYRVSYWTVLKGEPQLASGLLAIPRGEAPTAVVTWLAPTTSKRSDAASTGNDTATVLSAAFAGAGFLLLAPDYLGLGVSQTFHPYFDAVATADASLDFLTAGRTVCEGLGLSWPSKLALVGFSEGGWSTAVVQRALEAEPGARGLVGAAAIAPPLDLFETTFPRALEGKSKGDPMYLAYLAHAYSQLSGQPLESLFTDELAQRVNLLFDGEHDTEEIGQKLPVDPRALFRPGVLDQRQGWFFDALKANAETGWAPRAPLRLYYGEADVDVSPEDPKQSAAKLTANGGHVELIDVGPFDHNGTALRAIPRATRWLKELTAR